MSFDVNQVEQLVRELQGVVEELQNESVSSLPAELMRKRQFVWLDFAIDTYERDSPRAERLAEQLRELLSADLAIDDARNAWELRVWDGLLRDRQAQRGERGTLRWWEAAVKTVIEYSESPAYEVAEFPDLRTELRSNVDKALDDPDSLTRQFADPLGK
ncbi:MAG: hypothetical protein QOE97_249 [Pseudonocardiales bacterium]|nr:hypothetical protein [Pseudonocardiales bacterium]